MEKISIVGCNLGLKCLCVHKVPPNNAARLLVIHRSAPFYLELEIGWLESAKLSLHRPEFQMNLSQKRSI